MAHWLHAIVGRPAPLAGLAERHEAARVVDLPQGYAMVPLTDALLAKVDAAAIAAELSAAGPVAIVTTNYFGGTGAQSAEVWQHGRRTLGPLSASTDDADRATWPEVGPINQVLRAIGVEAAGEWDAFDALGLGRFRDTERAGGDA
jgi:hypothetical protein